LTKTGEQGVGYSSVSDFLRTTFLDEMPSLRHLGNSMLKFQSLLEACSEHVNDSRAEFSLFSMAKNSPVEITLAPKSPYQEVDKLLLFVQDTILEINQGVRPKCPQDLLQHFLIGTRFSIGYGTVQAETSELFESHLRGFLQSGRREFLTITGSIEAINIHEKREFRIFPKLGKPVKCKFEDSQFSIVQKAIGQVAKISGVAFFAKGERYPSAFNVESLKIMENLPPSPVTLRGIGSRDYAGIDAVAHVRSIRSEFEREEGLG
jgi:hypothetical protein